MTRADLIAFESEIADLFNAGKIPHPVHLESGNEDALINAFGDVKKHDYVAGTWRMHLKCLLHGVPRDLLKAAIMRGDSISLCFPEHRVYSSAIVGGIVPIALGIALGVKRRGGNERVHCFLGDMTAETGAFHEALKYSRNFDLPVRFIIEDNMMSVCTNTAEAWGGKTNWEMESHIVYYRYQSKWPHAGAGKRVEF